MSAVQSTDRGREAPSTEYIDQSLYEVRQKIYPRAVHGVFARWRWTLVVFTQLVFYGAPWLVWNDRQAVLFDLAARKFYIFGLVLWPQDFIYLTLLLVVSALALFLFTAIAGRLWCGYACPQTVYTEIFLLIERWIEGDHLAQRKLDTSGAGPRKVGLKAAKHGAWILLALWTGVTFVGYFTPIRDLLLEARHLALGGWEAFWIGFYGFATYGNAGWMREQVCKYMCPYARFQSAMFDPDTLIITYDPGRGEPRGARGRKADPKALGLGDCVDCGICVQVCPTGIDIRQGLQYECIGCAACIDGCDQVMHKMHYAPGLIRYSTENAMKHGWNARSILRRVLRPRVVLYGVALLVVSAGIATGLALRHPLRFDVIRDRASLAREVDERIENTYRLQVMNTAEAPQRFTLDVRGLKDAPERFEIVTDAPQPLAIDATTTGSFAVRVRAETGHARGSIPIEFVLASPSGFTIVEKSRFLFP